MATYQAEEVDKDGNLERRYTAQTSEGLAIFLIPKKEATGVGAREQGQLLTRWLAGFKSNDFRVEYCQVSDVRIIKE